MHVESTDKPCDSTSLLETLPGKLYIKRHSSSSFCLSVIIMILRYVIIFTLPVCLSVCLTLSLSLSLSLRSLTKIFICLLHTNCRLIWYICHIISIEKIYMVLNCIEYNRLILLLLYVLLLSLFI